MAALQNPREFVTLWDLLDPSGPAQVQLRGITAREWMARDTNNRYVEQLPPGTPPGPKVGINRIIIDPIGGGTG